MCDLSKRNSLLIFELVPDLITNRILILIMVLHLAASPISENPHSEGLVLFQEVINLKRKVMFPVPQQNVQQLIIF